MTSHRLAGLAFLCCAVLLPVASRAQTDVPLPRFDVRGYCVTMEVGSSGAYDTQRCLQAEARSSSAVKANWDRLPPEIRFTCARIARDAGPSFFVLEACLRNVAAGTWIELEGPGTAAERSQMISRSFRR